MVLGQCISRFTNRKVPYCVKFNPDEDKQNLFVAGMSDKKIVQVSLFIIFLLTLSPFIYVLDTQKVPPKTVSSEENLAYLPQFCIKNCALMNHLGNEQD